MFFLEGREPTSLFFSTPKVLDLWVYSLKRLDPTSWTSSPSTGRPVTWVLVRQQGPSIPETEDSSLTVDRVRRWSSRTSSPKLLNPESGALSSTTDRRRPSRHPYVTPVNTVTVSSTSDLSWQRQPSFQHRLHCDLSFFEEEGRRTKGQGRSQGVTVLGYPPFISNVSESECSTIFYIYPFQDSK